ncbi:MAG: hypothetical protein HY744_04015 [Deltaproteobacteria bacterium]|nr:hypothetical protein [Deltaproteobacteria bacterium]
MTEAWGSSPGSRRLPGCSLRGNVGRPACASVLGALLCGACLLDDGAYPGGSAPPARQHALVASILERFPQVEKLLESAAEQPAVVWGEPLGYRLASRRRPHLAASLPGWADEGTWRTGSVGVVAELPARADGLTSIRSHGHPEPIGVRRLNARSADASLHQGLLLCPGASEGVDVLLFGTRSGIEELLLVRATGAALGYEIDLPAGSKLRNLAPRLLEVVDAAGTAYLRLRAGRAWDARGGEVPLALELEGPRVHLLVGRASAWPVLVDPMWESTEDMAFARTRHTATLLKSGKVLIVGGYDDFDVHAPSLSPTEVFDPLANGGHGAYTVSASLLSGREEHTATLLESGNVLIAGGRLMDPGPQLRSAELFDPEADGGSGASTPTAQPMSFRRANHTATLLRSGKVLLVGSRGPSKAELFDPAANGRRGGFTAVSDDGGPPRGIGHTATLLEDGTVLLAGGCPQDEGTCSQQTHHTTNSAQLFYPGDPPQFTPVGPMLSAREHHAAALLPDGNVLIVGGRSGDLPPDFALASAELYHSTDEKSADGAVTYAGSFTETKSPMYAPRFGHTATTLAVNGWVLVVGGMGSDEAAFGELFDPGGRTFFATREPMPPTVVDGVAIPRRTRHAATMLGSGQSESVLIMGGALSEGAPPILKSSVRFEMQAPGSPCASGGECRSGFCVAGICCSSPCQGPCARCASGSCEPAAPGEPCGGLGYACSGSDTSCPEICSGDKDCDDAHRCEAKACVPTCWSAVDCAAGYRCDAQRRCVPIAAIPVGPAGCEHNGVLVAGPRRQPGWWLLLATCLLPLRRPRRRDLVLGSATATRPGQNCRPTVKVGTSSTNRPNAFSAARKPSPGAHPTGAG